MSNTIANAWCSVPPPHVPPLISLPCSYCTPLLSPLISSSVIGIPRSLTVSLIAPLHSLSSLMSLSVGPSMPSSMPIAPATAQSQQLPSPHVRCGTPMALMTPASILLVCTGFAGNFPPAPPLRIPPSFGSFRVRLCLSLVFASSASLLSFAFDSSRIFHAPFFAETAQKHPCYCKCPCVHVASCIGQCAAFIATCLPGVVRISRVSHVVFILNRIALRIAECIGQFAACIATWPHVAAE
eukprot:745173-Pleurochrysis_carterae.AAC.2